jgi:hypothetical protein
MIVGLRMSAKKQDAGISRLHLLYNFKTLKDTSQGGIAK